MKPDTKKTLYSLVILSLLTGLNHAIQAKKPEDPDKYFRAPNTLHGKTVLIPIGSHIEGRMNATISSKKSKQGEKFSIEITSPVLANGSDVIIPIGSEIIGEVVEAIPSSKQKKLKGMPKPSGKLRTQLSLLKTPDGVSRPLIASIAAELYSAGAGRISPNKALQEPSLGYAGSSANFSAVHPSVSKRNYGNRGPQVVSRRDYMRDPVLGVDRNSRKGAQRGAPIIRSMVKKGKDIYIMAGSPLTIRVDAPLQISIAPSRGRMSINMDTGASPMVQKDASGNFRRFQPAGQATNPDPSQPRTVSQEENKSFAREPMLKQPADPEAHLPRFLRTPKNVKFLKPAPFDTQSNSGNPQSAPQADTGTNSADPPPVQFSPDQAPPKSTPDDF